MRTILILLGVAILIGGAAAAGYKPAMDYWQKQNAPKWRTAEIATGEIISVVNATGTIKPVLQISVGSFVSGPIDADFRFRDHSGAVLLDTNGDEKRIADFNDIVVEKQILAKIDPKIYKANVERDKAIVDTKKADVSRFEALLEQAVNDEKRAYALLKEGKDYISQAEWDKVRFTKKSLDAQRQLAIAAVEQAEAQLEFSQLQLFYTDITSPVNGVIINRKIDPGQTVAAQFQTPEMFVIAKDMKKMHVHASVDEADIGLIIEAQRKKYSVTFTVDAYPDDLFTGEIEEVRLSSVTTQNVVTYPVVVGAPNPDGKLLPGMTPSISFEVDRRDNVLKVPNSALRFFPQAQHVRTEDKKLLEGQRDEKENNEQVGEAGQSAQDRAAARKKRTRRHVWVPEQYKLKAVEVQVGLSDSRFTELVGGSLKVGDKLVTGIQPATQTWGQ